MTENLVAHNRVPPLSGRFAPGRRALLVKRTLVGVALFLITILLLLWYIGVFGGNVRTVVPGKLYRSAVLTGHNLDTVLDGEQIRTIINLRGGSEKDAWYRSEVASCQARGIDRVDIPLSARKMPPPEQLRKLLHAFDTIRYPALVHCNAGADRAGLASTIYLHLYANLPLDEAQARGLTWRYGHIRYGIARPMSDFFDLYRQQSGGLGLREWILTRYPAIYDGLPSHLKGEGADQLRETGVKATQ